MYFVNLVFKNFTMRNIGCGEAMPKYINMGVELRAERLFF